MDPQPQQPNVPPPPLSADVTEMLRWTAAVSALVGHPESVEIQASVRTISCTFRDSEIMDFWATAISAVSADSVPDALGATVRATTTDSSLWRVMLYAHLPAVSR